MVSSALSLLYLVPVLGDWVSATHFAGDLMAVASVGLSIFVMVVTDTEHPPAAGTALGLVVGGWSLSAVLFVLIGAVMLSLANMVLRPRLTKLL